MIGRVLSIKKNPKGIYGFIKTDEGNYYYDTSSLHKGTRLKVGAKVQFDVIPWKGNQTKAVNVRLDKTSIEQHILEEDVRDVIRELIVTAMGQSTYLDASLISGILLDRGINYKNYAETLSDFFAKYYKNDFAIKKNYTINDKRYPAVLILNTSSTQTISEETVVKIRESFLREVSENGFVQAVKVPNILRNFGVFQYRDYATSIDDFIERYMPNTFVPKKTVYIGSKRYPKIYVPIENANEFLEVVEKKNKDDVVEPVIFDKILRINVGEGIKKIISSVGFIPESEMPNVLRSLGIGDYKLLANNIEEFISNYYRGIFEIKKNIVIGDKKFSSIIVFKSDNYDENEIGKVESSINDILLWMKGMLNQGAFEEILCHESILKYGPKDFGTTGIELLLKAIGGYLGEDIEHINLNKYHQLLIETETIGDLKQFKDSEEILRLGAEGAIAPMSLEEYKRVFADIHNGKKNINFYWNAIVERFWTAQSELAIYVTCLWLIITKHEKCMHLYIEEASKFSRIDKLILLLKVNQRFGLVNVSMHLQRKILGRCFDLNDINTLVASIEYFGTTMLPECLTLRDFLEEKISVDDNDIMDWFHSEIGEQISEKITNYYWWKYSGNSISQELFRVLASIYWEYPENYYTAIIYSPSCPFFGRKEKEQILKNEFVRLCEETKSYKKAFPWVNYLYLSLFEDDKDEKNELAWKNLHVWMQNEVVEHFSDNINSAGAIALFRLDPETRTKLEEQYCELYVAEIVEEFSDEAELDELVEICEKHGLQFITQWIIKHSGTNNVTDEEAYVISLCTSRKFVEAITYIQKASLSNEKKVTLLRFVLCENFKVFNVSEDAFSVFETSIPIDVAEAALRSRLVFADHDEIGALIALYYYKKEWIKLAYLLAPFKVFYIDAHRKLIEDTRILVQKNYNVDLSRFWSNHYEVVKRALRVYDNEEFDEFIDWAKSIIKIPMGSNKYALSPRTFDSTIQSMITGGDKDSCWSQLVKMALRTDNEDRQDNLRFSIIASYIGRYGIESIEKVINSLTKNASIMKGFSDFYISLWKGLLNGKYAVNFLRLCQRMIGEAPITFWNLFYDIAVCKNHVFSKDDFELNAMRSDEQDYQSFYTACLNCYNETRENVYLKIAVALLKDCSVDIEPEFDKYISFGVSSRNKAFLFSALAILLEQGRYKEEIQGFVCSEYWNCSSMEHDVLKLLNWCCSDDMYDESLTEAEIARFKRECLRCIKDYPAVDVDYALRETDENYRLKLIKEILKIQYSPKLRGEAENAPEVVMEWKTDGKLKDYLEFVSLLYQKQLNKDENMYNDAVFVKNRYVRIFVAKFLLEENMDEYDDDQIISLMGQNKHRNSVYYDYEKIKKAIIEFWKLDVETEFHKVVFLVGLLSNKWDQFICNAHDYKSEALEIINNIEEQTNYRDFNIQIINQYFDAEYQMSELSYLKICAPKAYTILQELQKIKTNSEDEFLEAKKLLNGICRLKYPGKAQRSYAYMKRALQTYSMELQKHWDLFMLALDVTSYRKTIIINLLDEIRKRKIEIEEIKLWMPVFHYYKNISVYYYMLSAKYALERKKEEALETFSFIGDKNVLPKEWREDVKNLEDYLFGKVHFFSMISNSMLQTLVIEKDAEAVSFIEKGLAKDEITVSKAISAYRTILNKETEDLVKLNAYKQLFGFVKRPDDLFDIYRQVESKSSEEKKNRLSYNELLIEYGCLLICLEDGMTMDKRMQILLEVFGVFEFLNDINKGKVGILERMRIAEQSVLEKPGVSFEKWIDNRDRIISILKHPAVTCSENIISNFCKPLEECMHIVSNCTSEMQKLFELSTWRDKWNLQQNCSDYEYAFVRSVDEKIKNLKSGVNLSISIVNKTIEDFSVFFCVENKAEVSNTTVALNNTCENGAARLEVLVAINGSDLASYEGSTFTNIVELRPGDVCGQYYRLHRSIVSSIKDGDWLTIVLNVIVGNKIICDCRASYIYKSQGNIVALKDRLVSRISKYETSVPAFSKTIKGFGRESEKQLIRQYLDEQLVVIYGPSRVGKSSLVNYISNEYAVKYSEDEQKSVITIGIADDRHGNDYRDDMIHEGKKVSFDNISDLLRYLFISPLQIAFGSEARLKLKSRMRCGFIGEKLTEKAWNEIESIISSEGSAREIVAVVSQILEENNCQVWYLFDEFQQIIEKWNGDTTELTDLCNDIMNHQSSIKIVFCGSDELVRLYQCENDVNWRGFIQKTADNCVAIGQLSEDDFYAMMEDASIWGDISQQNPWSQEALKLLYQYTGGNAICGKLFGNELLDKIRRGDFDSKERLYPSDITQVAYELLNSEVGLVRNLLVLHNTKNLKEEIPYLIFVAHELVQDKNRADISIRRIREFFAVKTPVEIENALKILIARGILKVNEEKQRYGFSTMFYFDFFRSQATEVKIKEILDEIKLHIPNEKNTSKIEHIPLTDPKKITQLIFDLWSDLGKIDETNPEKSIARDSIKNHIGTVINTKQVNQGEGRINEGNEITNNIQINIQNMTSALINIVSGHNILESYRNLPTLGNYIDSQLTEQAKVDLKAKYEALQDYGISESKRQQIQEEIYEISSPAIDAIANDYVAAEMNAIMNGTYSDIDEIMDDEDEIDKMIGISQEDINSLKQSLPSNIQIQFDFAIMLHKIFYRLKQEEKIDYCPVAILYCKMIEGLLKEKHFEIYIKKLSRGNYPKVRLNGREYEWGYFLDSEENIDRKKIRKSRKNLTIGSFSFPLGGIVDINDMDSEVVINQNVVEALATPLGENDSNLKDLQLWTKHAELLPWIRVYRNRCAHELTPISCQDMDNICKILFKKKELDTILRLIQRQ